MKMVSLVLFVLGGLLAATEGCGPGKQLLRKLHFIYVACLIFPAKSLKFRIALIFYKLHVYINLLI